MKYYKKIVLKDGRECILRNGSAEDAEGALQNFIATHEQTDFLLSYPDESSREVEKERDYLVKKEESDNEAEILAIVDSLIVGTAGIDSIGDKYKVKHRAEFGISVDKDYWNLGIGSALISACLECAKKAGYEQVELNVVADNDVAIKMYEKAGFTECGRNPKGFNSRISGFQELVYMRRELS